MKPISGWIQTSSNTKFDYESFTKDSVSVEDIAHSLSHICRFCGHTREFYSVAQHSVLVALNVREEKHFMHALFHDASEAYISDIPRPLKRNFYKLQALERLILRRVFEKLEMSETLPEEVHYWDNVLIATEARDLFSSSVDDWTKQLPQPLTWSIRPLPPQAAKQLFLDAFYSHNSENFKC